MFTSIICYLSLANHVKTDRVFIVSFDMVLNEYRWQKCICLESNDIGLIIAKGQCSPVINKINGANSSPSLFQTKI